LHQRSIDSPPLPQGPRKLGIHHGAELVDTKAMLHHARRIDLVCGKLIQTRQFIDINAPRRVEYSGPYSPLVERSATQGVQLDDLPVTWSWQQDVDRLLRGDTAFNRSLSDVASWCKSLVRKVRRARSRLTPYLDPDSLTF
jgi:hypothetical protein